MNFYQHWLGDYMRDTQSLTMQQHGAYRMLLDYQYSTELRISSVEEACRIAKAMSEIEQKDVKIVLEKFFIQRRSNGFWTNPRFEEELIKYKKRQLHMLELAKKSVAVRERAAQRTVERSVEPRVEHSNTNTREESSIRNLAVIGSVENSENGNETLPVGEEKTLSLDELGKQIHDLADAVSLPEENYKARRAELQRQKKIIERKYAP